MANELEDGELASGDDDVQIIEETENVIVDSRPANEAPRKRTKSSTRSELASTKSKTKSRKNPTPPKRQTRARKPYNELSKSIPSPQRLLRGTGSISHARASPPPPQQPQTSYTPPVDQSYSTFPTGPPPQGVYPLMGMPPQQMHPQHPQVSGYGYQGQPGSFGYPPMSVPMQPPAFNNSNPPFGFQQHQMMMQEQNGYQPFPQNGYQHQDNPSLVYRRSVDMDISDTEAPATNAVESSYVNIDELLEQSDDTPVASKKRKGSFSRVKLRKRKDLRSSMREELRHLRDYLGEYESGQSEDEDCGEIRDMIKTIEAKCEEVVDASKKFDDVMQTFNQAMITMYYCSRAVTKDSIDYMKHASQLVREARKSAARKWEKRYQHAEKVIKRTRSMLDEISDEENEDQDDEEPEVVPPRRVEGISSQTSSSENAITPQPQPDVTVAEPLPPPPVAHVMPEPVIASPVVEAAQNAETSTVVADSSSSTVDSREGQPAPIPTTSKKVQSKPIAAKILKAFKGKSTLITRLTTKAQRRKNRKIVRDYFNSSKESSEKSSAESAESEITVSVTPVSSESDAAPSVEPTPNPVPPAPIDDVSLEREEALRQKLLLKKKTNGTPPGVKAASEAEKVVAPTITVPTTSEAVSIPSTASWLNPPLRPVASLTTVDLISKRTVLTPRSNLLTIVPTVSPKKTSISAATKKVAAPVAPQKKTTALPAPQPSTARPTKPTAQPATRAQSDTVLSQISNGNASKVTGMAQKRSAPQTNGNPKVRRTQPAQDSENTVAVAPIIAESITSSIRASILNPNSSIEKGLEILRKNADDSREVCYFEQFGICHDARCPYQHVKDFFRTDQQIVEEVISFIPARNSVPEPASVQAKRLLVEAKGSLVDAIVRLRQECADLNYITLARDAVVNS